MSRCDHLLRKARALGVTVAVGTDSSYGDGDDYGRVRPAHEIVPTTLFEPLLVLSDGRVALDRLALR